MDLGHSAQDLKYDPLLFDWFQRDHLVFESALKALINILPLRVEIIFSGLKFKYLLKSYLQDVGMSFKGEIILLLSSVHQGSNVISELSRIQEEFNDDRLFFGRETEDGEDARVVVKRLAELVARKVILDDHVRGFNADLVSHFLFINCK